MPLRAKAPYSRDDDGAPVMALSYVLFLDVLGASEMAKAEDAGAELAAFDQAIAQGRKRSTDDLDEPWFLSSWFSDNLALGSPIEPGLEQGEPELGTFLNVAGTVQLHLALDGFFTRGGLALGLHFMDDNITFGPALVEAVDLERRAVHPRVLLGDSAVRLVRQHLAFYGSQPTGAPHHRDLWVDGHGETFINYLDAIGNYVGEEMREAVDLVAQHRDQIVANLDKHRSDFHVWNKYAWAAEYHNAFCQAHDLEGVLVDDVLTDRQFMGVGAWPYQ